MDNLHESRRPRVSAIDDLIMPEFPALAAETIEEAFNLTHYTCVPLITSSWRRAIFGTANPSGIQHSFATRGFVIHTAEILESGIDSEMFIAPSPGLTSEAFLTECITSLDLALPTREDFPMPLRRVAVAMSRIGIKTIVGFSMSSMVGDDSKRFPSLFLPRVLLSGEFKGPNDTEPDHEFGIKLSAATFALLAMRQLRAMGNQGIEE